MIFSYEECIKRYSSYYKIKKVLDEGKLYKIGPGIYSDRTNEPDTAVIKAKYPNAVFTLNSGFYYHGLTDTIPSFYFLATDKDAAKIKDKSIKQIFDNNKSIDIGVQSLDYNGDYIRVFSKERLLIELIRNKNNLPFDYYKEIIGNYRNMIYQLDFQLVEEFAKQLPKTKKVMEAIQMEVL